jgi:hypothetical protein
MTPTIQQLNQSLSEKSVPTQVQINHDLNFLYTIARTVLPKDILEALMYGEDFEEPSEEDLIEVKLLIFNNRIHMMTKYEDIKLEE